MFVLVAMVIFSVAMYIAAYYVWTVPQREAERLLAGRMRGLRASMRGHQKSAPELVRREHRGSFAFLGDLVTWVGILRRLQETIEQANLKYRAADVFGFSVLLAATAFVVFGVAGGWNLIFVQLLVAAAFGMAPVFYIGRVRARRLHKFE